MIYVPPGRFVFGSSDEESMRKLFFYATPLHQISTGAYLIAREEVSFGQWIEFLNDLPADEQTKYAPSMDQVKLERVDDTWVVSFGPVEASLKAAEGELLVFSERPREAEQDWARWPIIGIGRAGAQAYVAWLDRTGRVPGARLCTELEWERAVRGADDRVFGHGNVLHPDDANYLGTFGVSAAVSGPAPVGSFADSASPFGLYNTQGNAVEWTLSTVDDEALMRGGGFEFDSMQGRTYNRGVVHEDFHTWSSGVRICASYVE
jgi:formylglycine-generating enzyme required for sulfatase activity